MTFLLSPQQLHDMLTSPQLRVVEVATSSVGYGESHIPGAVLLPYSALNIERGDAKGEVPNPAQLTALLEQLAITPDSQVVIYDREGGGRAARLLWTLDLLQHPSSYVLDGGWLRCLAAGLETTPTPSQFPPTQYPLNELCEAIRIDKMALLAALNEDNLVIWDTRSAAEYHGDKALAARGGHIPGAVNYEWTRAIDAQAPHRLKPLVKISDELAELGISPDKRVICYCQTHHRSAFAYMLMKALGFSHIQAYPGSWSEWGNDPSLPIEV